MYTLSTFLVLVYLPVSLSVSVSLFLPLSFSASISTPSLHLSLTPHPIFISLNLSLFPGFIPPLLSLYLNIYLSPSLPSYIPPFPALFLVLCFFFLSLSVYLCLSPSIFVSLALSPFLSLSPLSLPLFPFLSVHLCFCCLTLLFSSFPFCFYFYLFLSVCKAVSPLFVSGSLPPPFAVSVCLSLCSYLFLFSVNSVCLFDSLLHSSSVSLTSYPVSSQG